MNKITFLIINILYCKIVSSQHITFQGNETPTWQETISSYDELDLKYEQAKLLAYGTTDVGKPLHLFVINKDEAFYPEHFDSRKSILLINNAIHAGEPDGVDASIIFAKELLDPSNVLHRLLDSVIICIIPIYNVDGSLMRNAYSRSNQNGPSSYGFRANSKNLDLNRDFIKCDSQNALTFNRIFQLIEPHILIDTHVSNGADYPYVMTLIATQKDKIGEPLKSLVGQMENYLFNEMKSCGFEMCPYVNHMGRTPDTGIADFLETPRFATGYAALHHVIGFTTETHMLKPYAERVESTYSFLVSGLKYMYLNNQKIIRKKRESVEKWMAENKYAFNYNLQKDSAQSLLFKGYEAVIEPALVGTGDRLRYDRSKPYEKNIAYFRKYVATDTIEIPKAYVIPQGWQDVIERLDANDVRMLRLDRDTTMNVVGYYLYDLETNSKAYEGHFIHNSVKTKEEQMNIRFFQGDYIVPVEQKSIRYIIECLEPKSKDSFFSWNFFDSTLQQKEWFSDYVFEEKAEEILRRDPQLKVRFDLAMQSDPEMQEHWMQLYWIYRNSEFCEKSAFRYPLYKLVSD